MLHPLQRYADGELRRTTSMAASEVGVGLGAEINIIAYLPGSHRWQKAMNSAMELSFDHFGSYRTALSAFSAVLLRPY